MEIVIYDCHWREQIKTNSKQKRNWFSSYLGYFLVLVSLAVFSLTAGPVLITEAIYRIERNDPLVLQEQALATNQEKEEEKKAIVAEAANYGVSTNFSIVIPKIKAQAEIIANVNPASEEEYQEALKYGVAHALETSFPGEQGTTYLFAHSSNPLIPTDFSNAVFYLIRELAPQDQIIVFYSGQKFVYEVIQNITTSADDITWLTQQSAEEQLILQTCWPPGTRQKRLLVIAKPASPTPKY
jgi:LPXTG-site transpeptidase (sortase) family protein